MTKLQRKRAVARERRFDRQQERLCCGMHCDPWDWRGREHRGAYHTKHPAWRYGMGRKGLPLGGRYVLAGLLGGLRLNQREQAALVELTAKPWGGIDYSHTEIHPNG